MLTITPYYTTSAVHTPEHDSADFPLLRVCTRIRYSYSYKKIVPSVLQRVLPVGGQDIGRVLTGFLPSAGQKTFPSRLFTMHAYSRCTAVAVHACIAP